MKSRIPHTYEEAFAILDRRLKKTEKIALGQADDLDDYHFGLGLWIRNNWIHTDTNQEFLCEEQKKEDDVLYCPDNMSEDLLCSYQKHVQDKYNIMTRKQHLRIWKRLHKQLMDKCMTTLRPYTDDVLVEFWDQESNETISCTIDKAYMSEHFVRMQSFELRYEIAIEDRIEALSEYVHFLERILRHMDSTSNNSFKPDINATWWMYYDNLPNRYGLFSIYDVHKHKMIYDAIVNGERFVLDFYAAIMVYVDEHENDINRDAIRSEEIESYYRSHSSFCSEEKTQK